MLIEVKPLEINPEVYYTVIGELYKKTDFFDYNKVESFLSDIVGDVYRIWINDFIIVLGEYRLYETGMDVMNLTVVNYSGEDCPSFSEDINQLESELNVDRVILEGRLGWKKIFKDYKHSSLILYKDI